MKTEGYTTEPAKINRFVIAGIEMCDKLTGKKPIIIGLILRSIDWPNVSHEEGYRNIKKIIDSNSVVIAQLKACSDAKGKIK